MALSLPQPALITWLSELTGVAPVITRRSFTKHRCTEHCPSSHQSIESLSARWSVTGARATVVLRAVRPWLIFQADAADWVLELTKDSSFKPATVEKMRALGWPVPEKISGG